MTDTAAGLAGLGPFIITTLLVHGPWSPFFPAAYEPMLLLFGKLYPPLLIAVLGAVLSVAMEGLNYRIYGWLANLKRIESLKQKAVSGRLVKLFERRPFLVVFLFGLLPAPDWGARILGVLSGFPADRYLLAFLLGRIPKFWFLAAVGQALPVSKGVMLVVAIVITVISLAAAVWRKPDPRADPAAER